MNLLVLPNTGSFLIIVVKLYSYIDSKVGNLRKFKYFYEFYIHSQNVKYNLTSNLIFSRIVESCGNESGCGIIMVHFCLSCIHLLFLPLNST